jgi:hypothetical protein
MSLNKTLDRLFDEIRREARRNQAFADRLDGVMRAHVSRRDVSAEDAAEEAAAEAAEEAIIEAAEDGADLDLNPVGFIQREGEDALELALIDIDRESLLALVAEHNLDPAGEAVELDHDALVAHVVIHAKRRAERDKKLFDY